MNRRALAPVLGLTLLLGITAIGSIALLVVGGTIVSDIEGTTQETQAEESMVQLSSAANDIALDDAERVEVSVSGSEDATVSTRADTGHVVVNATEDDDILFERDLGAVEYRMQDGTVFAYQGGGVFRLDPDGEARLVQPPDFQYRPTPQPTVIFPMVNVTGGAASGGESGILLNSTQRTAVYPTNPDQPNPLNNGSIVVRMDSDYCEAWQEYFISQTDSAVIEPCGIDGPDTVEGEVQVELTVPFNFNGAEGNAAEDITEAGNADVYGQVNGHDHESATELIEDKVADCGGTDNLTTSVSSPGLYCTDTMDSQAGYTFDTSSGDIEVAVSESMDRPGNVDIVGDGNVTFFVNGSTFTDLSGNFVIGEQSDPTQLRVFVRSGADVGHGGWGNVEFYGLLYAPNSEVETHGTPGFNGAIIAEKIHAQGNVDIQYDPAMSDIEQEYEFGGPSVYYLHVTETQVQIEDQDSP